MAETSRHKTEAFIKQKDCPLTSIYNCFTPKSWSQSRYMAILPAHIRCLHVYIYLFVLKFVVARFSRIHISGG